MRASESAGSSRRRCWNCRARKIACDKTEPACTNCIQRGKVCPGYGLQLSWPRSNNPSRSAQGKGYFIQAVDSSSLEFINVTNDDIETSATHHIDRTASRSEIAQLSMLRTLEPVRMRETEIDPQFFMSDCSAVSRLITTSPFEDELYSLLYRLSLHDDSAASLAPRHALSAISYQHLGRHDEALFHQTLAMQALQTVIESPVEISKAMQMMASSMLLNIFETLIFDGSSLSWAIFFCGTKRIARTIHERDNTYQGDYALILDWVFYHDAMYKLSIRHWQDKVDQQRFLAADEKIISKAVFSPDRQVILPALGCSQELLDLLCQIVDLVLDRHDPRHLSEDHLKAIRSMELRLDRLEQQLPMTADLSTAQSIRNLAEFCRLTTYVYLERLAKATPWDDRTSKRLVDQAFILLKNMGGCDRPWPLFILGFEARSDEERKLVLDSINVGLSIRPLGNLTITKRMLQAGWIQQDLQEGVCVDPLSIYDRVISANRVPPSFA